MDIFTNREKATIIWIILVIAILLFNKQFRTIILQFFKSILKKRILVHVAIYVFTYLFYFSIFILVLYHFKLWNINYLKDAIIWFVFSGLRFGFLAITDRNLERDFWKRQILDNLKLVAFFEFYVNLYSFSLKIELFIIPIISLMVIIRDVSKIFSLDKVIEKSTEAALSFIGFLILLFSLYKTITEIDSITNIDTLKYFAFPIIYSAIGIIFVYFFVLYTKYEILYKRLLLGRPRSRKLNLNIMLRIFVLCNIDLKKVEIVIKSYGNLNIQSKNEIDNMIRRYKDILAEKKSHRGK